MLTNIGNFDCSFWLPADKCRICQSKDMFVCVWVLFLFCKIVIWFRSPLFSRSSRDLGASSYKSNTNDSPTKTSERGGGRGGINRGLLGGDTVEWTLISTQVSLDQMLGAGLGGGVMTTGCCHDNSCLAFTLVFSKLYRASLMKHTQLSRPF
jgi:predicted permease